MVTQPRSQKELVEYLRDQLRQLGAQPLSTTTG